MTLPDVSELPSLPLGDQQRYAIALLNAADRSFEEAKRGRLRMIGIARRYLSPAQIAAVLGISRDSVQRMVKRAKDELGDVA